MRHRQLFTFRGRLFAVLPLAQEDDDDDDNQHEDGADRADDDDQHGETLCEIEERF